MKNGMELLSPAGGLRELKAAVVSGADAVYLGATAFSARAGAGNFTEDEMREAVAFAHTYGVKVHCAINTLIKETELGEAVSTAVLAAKCGVDALIIQDIGFAGHIRKVLPDMELHASTQMTVTSLEGVRYLEKKGFSRVVLARELSLDEIEHIAKNAKAEIEVFVHGAICVCYSGQCLMSSILGGRSGNRGRCAQPCRLPYELTEGEKICGSGYILSPKDMALIKHLDKLRKAGVASLKIEGRLKSAEYVSAVVGVYRKYLDSNGAVTDEDMAELKNAFSRSGFTDGYLTKKLGREMMSHKNPANNSGSTFTDEAKLRAEGKHTQKIPVDIYASLNDGDVFRVTVCLQNGVCASAEGKVPAERAINRPLDKSRIAEQLKKLGDTPFYASSVTVDAEEGITVPIKEINEARRTVCDMLTAELVLTDEKQIKEMPIDFDEKTTGQKLYLTAGVRTESQGKAVIKAGGVKRIYASPDVAEKLLVVCGDTEIVSVMSDIFTDEEVKTESVSASSPADIYKYKERAKYGEWRLNIYNSLSVKEYKNLECVTLSPELNLTEIRTVAEHTDGIQTEIIGYGHLPLMIMKNCPVKAMGKCQDGKDLYQLRDRKGMKFPIICQKDCRALLLNSKPIYTADMTDEIRKAKVDCIRLNFTVESPDECETVVTAYKNALAGIRQPAMPENTFTRGHLKRGVL